MKNLNCKNLKDEFSAFCDFEGTLLEAVEVVVCQDEKSFLPPEMLLVTIFKINNCQTLSTEQSYSG